MTNESPRVEQAAPTQVSAERLADSPSQGPRRVRAEEATVVILGASGDLTARKLVPALYALARQGYLSERSPVVGVARREKTDQSFREEMREALRVNADDAEWQGFARRLFYRQADLTNADGFTQLKSSLETIEREAGVSGKRVVYMATAPELFLPSIEGLHAAGMVPPPDGDETLRVVLEKPFGHDLNSARELSSRLGRLLAEEQTYRIDHYLGKETVQNILLFRFGNSIFEPLLNRGHVDHVQITVAESQGIERGRGGYYDKAGALRDVLQNHVLQLLCLTAMEPPSYFLAKHIHDERMKVVEALRPGEAGPVDRWAVAGQYTAGRVGGEAARSYREEDRIDPSSRRETYVALSVRIDNWRWAGVPFYLRTGKRLPERATEVAIQFKLPPQHLFTTVECEGDICDLVEARPNTLVFRIQPHEGISLMFSTKRPGMQYQIHPVTMDFTYTNAFHTHLPEAYERLLLDVLRGDSTLFTRSDELEAAWRFVQPVLDAWERPEHQPHEYAAGSGGPAAADTLLSRRGHRWRRPGTR
ncbi:MAG: glucose-6-phosphate dehydrogenase [Planctomycetes bacterium]|nr:glucose-6-phosphate dehydrogenase [Planctomycetota bacterium]